MSMQQAVSERYSAGAHERAEALCCPVQYDTALLDLLPAEILEKDYGCGDPSRFVQPGDTVLDLGSGSGKICYMAAQRVGDAGRVIGVDMNDDMLALARRYQAEMAKRLGGDRVRFVKGRIQDLALDLDAMEAWLAEHPVTGVAGADALEDWKARQRREHPLIAAGSVDLVISNCVLNLVDDGQKRALIDEVYRVVRPGGRVAISDIVSDRPVPARMKADPELWSGCISGAFQEQEMPDAFIAAGFQAVRIEARSSAPWRVVEGVEFRSVTVTAVKPDGNDCIDRGQAVIYRGPFSTVSDDEGHVYARGERVAVCERTYRLLTEGPYRDAFAGIEPGAGREAAPCCTPPAEPGGCCG